MCFCLAWSRVATCVVYTLYSMTNKGAARHRISYSWIPKHRKFKMPNFESFSVCGSHWVVRLAHCYAWSVNLVLLKSELKRRKTITGSGFLQVNVYFLYYFILTCGSIWLIWFAQCYGWQVSVASRLQQLDLPLTYPVSLG